MKKPKVSSLDRSMRAKKGLIKRRLASVPSSMAASARLRNRLERALLAQGRSTFVASQTAFHMTDWLEDLLELHDLYTGRSRWSSKRVEMVLMGFLFHVPNHVAAAAKLLADSPVQDIFQVGAVEGGVTKRRVRKH